MQLITVDRISNKIIGNTPTTNIPAPPGWEIAKESDGVVLKEPFTEALKKRIGFHLPYIAYNVETYIDEVALEYGVEIPEAIISLDDDSTFHITLLVKTEDYRTPEFYAAKIRSEKYLSTTGTLSMRCTFSVKKEYARSYHAESVKQLKYVYRTPVLQPATRAVNV